MAAVADTYFAIMKFATSHCLSYLGKGPCAPSRHIAQLFQNLQCTLQAHHGESSQISLSYQAHQENVPKFSCMLLSTPQGMFKIIFLNSRD